MSSEIFNPNPTVFVTNKPTRPALQFAKPNSLWLNDPEAEQESDDEDDTQSDEAEAIDQDEIFGTPFASVTRWMIHVSRYS